jgi:hypothetical protein
VDRLPAEGESGADCGGPGELAGNQGGNSTVVAGNGSAHCKGDAAVVNR